MNLRVLIADDEPLCRQRLRQFLRAEPGNELVGECINGTEAVTAIRKQAPDVVFLDVKMPELDGFDVIKSLSDIRLPAIVFVTAYDQFALRAFETHAVDYLLKPFNRVRFQTALRRVRERLQRDLSSKDDPTLLNLLKTIDSRHSSLERVTIRSDGRITVLKTAEIDWICAADNYVELHLGKATHLLRTTVTALASQLPQNRFVQTSRSLLVNVDRIKEIRPKAHGDYSIILRDGTSLPGSRNHRRQLERLLFNSV